MIASLKRSRIRLVAVVLGVTAVTVTGAATVIASTPRAGSAAAGPLVEDEGANCAVTLPGTLTANAKLPDPFRKLDGTRVTGRAEWPCRREEIKKLAERYVYGEKPAKPPTVTGTVSGTSITVTASANGHSASFTAGVQLPGGTGPFPAVVVVGGLGADTSTILGAGVAVINYNPLSVGAEGTPRTNKQGAFYTLYGATSGTGLLVAWAWGVSRIIDVIEQSGGNVLKADALGVTGCSRYGKGAFAIGAFDQRIALTMPIESGSAGVPILRGIPGESGAQPLSSAYSEQPWLGDAFNSFTGNPTTLPVDTHELIGMVAPRGLFIMENPHIDWLAARSGSVAAQAGAEVYKALGAGDNISYWSDVQDGTHCAVRPEWRAPLLQNLQKFLLKTGNAAGVFRISGLKAGNLADWKDWQTPTLTGGPTSAPPTTPASTPPTSPPPSGACRVADVISAWNTGLTSNITITNTSGGAIDGWSLAFALPSGQSIVPPGWNASYAPTSGQVTATNLAFNTSLPPGGSTTIGFQANHTGNTAAPASFSLNGATCATA